MRGNLLSQVILPLGLTQVLVPTLLILRATIHQILAVQVKVLLRRVAGALVVQVAARLEVNLRWLSLTPE